MHKEQIIIDGVEVLKEKINMCFILLLNKLETPETIEQTIYEHLDAFVKEWNAQLARKTQIIDDVEEVIKIRLGGEVNRSETLLKELKRFDKIKDEFREMSEKLKSENDRYRKALEEIEQELKEDIYCESQECGCDDSEECLRCTKDLILDIINKVKRR